MPDKVNVLVWGTAQEGPCAYFRGHLFDEPLRAAGIETRHISKVDFRPAKGWEHRDPMETYRAGMMELDTTDLEWADVVLFRRYYNTTIKCERDRSEIHCGFLATDPDVAAKHEHKTFRQDDITRALWPLIRDHWTGAIVYETDDNHWEIKPWNGYYRDVVAERDLIAEMTRRADIVTVSTPPLVEYYGKYNRNVRVVRNAIDPDLYVKDTERADDRTRLVYYGATARLRDYAGFPDERGRWKGGYAKSAVDAAGVHRVFLGTTPGTEAVISQYFDEQTEYIEGIAAFSKALANSHGDIGIAPLGGDDFDRSKSELHWLEYAMSDTAFIGERFRGEGPYSVVRNGVDGLLARGAQEWHDAVRRLARNPGLREELAGRAKERVLAEYDYRVRAQEWIDVFRWAAEHPRIHEKAAA